MVYSYTLRCTNKLFALLQYLYNNMYINHYAMIHLRALKKKKMFIHSTPKWYWVKHTDMTYFFFLTRPYLSSFVCKILSRILAFPMNISIKSQNTPTFGLQICTYYITHFARGLGEGHLLFDYKYWNTQYSTSAESVLRNLTPHWNIQ